MYSVPGHSCIQEVDNAHSQIEKKMKSLEIWSPLSLLKVILNVNNKKPFIVLQMNSFNFKDFHSISKKYNFNLIPFFSVSQLRFSQMSPSDIEFKTTHKFDYFKKISILSNNSPYLVDLFKNPPLSCNPKT